MGNSEWSKREIWVGSSLPAKSTIAQTPLGKDFGSSCYLFIQALGIQLILGYLQRNAQVCIEPPCHKGNWLCSQDNREVLVPCNRLHQPRQTMPVPGLFLSKCMGNPFLSSPNDQNGATDSHRGHQNSFWLHQMGGAHWLSQNSVVSVMKPEREAEMGLDFHAPPTINSLKSWVQNRRDFCYTVIWLQLQTLPCHQ